jgi:hypothetical protein
MLTAGVLSQVAVLANSITVSSTAASGGTGPYTEAYYISTVTGFTPSGANIVAGASGLLATISGLIPNTQYYVKVVYTDTGASNATVTSSQLAISTTAPVLNPNQFAQTQYLGTIDLRFDYDTVSAQIDVSQVGSLYAGAPVKLVPYSFPNQAPKVIGIQAATDEVWGYINFDIKTVQYVAGSLCEVSQAGNVMYLYSTAAITQGSQVIPTLSTMGGVAQVTGASDANIVGYAYDGANAAGQLIRIRLSCPSFAFDG